MSCSRQFISALGATSIFGSKIKLEVFRPLVWFCSGIERIAQSWSIDKVFIGPFIEVVLSTAAPCDFEYS